MRADLEVIGPQTTRAVRVGAAATRYEVGEPLHSLVAHTTGTADLNVYVLAAADTPVIGTHTLGGVAISRCLPLGTGTVVAHTAQVARPIAWAGRIRGRAQTVGSIDTASELLGVINDISLIDYNATGGTDGGELYTIREDDTGADTGGLVIVDGDTFKGTLEVEVDGRSYRWDVA